MVTWLDVIEVIGVLGGIVAMIITFILLRKQVWLDNFNNYTTRYNEIIGAFPIDILISNQKSRKNLTDFDLESQNSIIKAVLQYFNLISEEQYVWKKKVIKKEDGECGIPV